MKFPTNKPVKITVLGTGGTGGHAIPHLYRLLHSLGRPAKILICDGDTVEEKNLLRQNFIKADLGKNKAQALAERYAPAFRMELLYVPEFIENESRLAELVKPDVYCPYPHSHQTDEALSVLIGCVDNNKSRQMCHNVFMASRNLTYIDSGNGEHTGQVICGVRRGGRTYGKPAGSLYPDILENPGKFPSQLSCAEAAVSEPQTIAANIMAATAIVSFAYNMLAFGEIKTKNVTFSTKTVNMKPGTAA